MAVPRNRISNARKNSRRAHHAKKPVSSGVCSHCGAAKLAHRICSSCGNYRDRNFFAQKEDEK